MDNFTLAEMSTALESGEVSSFELTQHFLQRIEKLDSIYNSFVTNCHDQALTEASAADARRKNGNSTALTGIPIAHKDIFCTKGVRTSCGSKMLDNFISPYDATVVTNLKNAGAVALGKTNMDEFAMGSSNETSWYGSVKNPWNTSCVPGGSSGGSAAAVAARLAPAATATDTGGSIRQPASLCGVTGLKPTYGRVSRWGMIAFASSLDQGGPIAKTAEDCAIMLNAMAGFDSKDSTSVERAVPNYCSTLNNSISGLKVGIPKEYFGEGLSQASQKAVEIALNQLEDQGAELVEISLPNSHLSVPAYYVIAPAECSANLSRFDGVRYGHRCEDPTDLEDLYCRTRGEGFGDEVKRRILVGTYVLSAGYYDAYYRKAQQVRRLIRDDFIKAFEDVDVIAGPSCPSTAFEFGAKSTNPVEMYLEDIYTIAANLAGLPGMSIPCGFAEAKPIGLQLIGKYFEEDTLLNIAHQYQSATNWHKQRPARIE